MAMLMPRVRRFLSIPRSLAAVRAGAQPFVHSPQFLALPPAAMLAAICGPVRGRLGCPPGLTIVLVHDYRRTPLTERSLRYVGIDDYVVLRRPTTRRFVNTDKLRALAGWLESGACRTGHVLYLDAGDVFVRNDPAIALRLLERRGCDLLFSSEQGPHVYECMPEVKAWTDGVADSMGCPRRYLNAGVFVGRKDFLGEVITAALAYAEDDEFSHRELVAAIRAGNLRDRLPRFPAGCGSDQGILRYLHPRFFPRMQVDFMGDLAWRNLPEGGGL